MQKNKENNLEDINVVPKTGNETFLSKQEMLSFSVKNFWSWAYSDLVENRTRGILAEYLVKEALGISSESRVEWDAYDFEMENGLKIEVKSAAYLQTWKQTEYSKISFDIAPKKSFNTTSGSYSNELKRNADIYVFCLLHHRHQETLNPLNLEQWIFYILPTSVLNKKSLTQKKITLNALLKLKPKMCRFEEIKSTISEKQLIESTKHLNNQTN